MEQTNFDQASYVKFLSRYFTAWENLSSEEQETFIEHSKVMYYPKFTCIHSGDQTCAGLLLVKSGMLRTYLLSEEGKDITLYRLGPGDMCILSASCMLSNITFDVHIDAEENTELWMISAPYFARLAESNIYVENFSYKMAADRFSDVMWAMQQLLFMKMDQRLAIFLWDEIAKAQGDTIHYTHEQVAKYMGSAREVVTRMLKHFVSEGIVQLSRGGIKVIDKNKLRALIGS